MSWSELHVQDHKQRTDCAIHRACARLASDPSTFKTFQEMLYCAWKRAPRLFESPVSEERHLGVETLVNPSRFRGAHVRPAIDWAGSSASWRPALSSLAQHLICDQWRLEFLLLPVHATDAAADKKRSWFVAHSRGASFRSLDLPIVMTRKMEHIFLASQDHLPIEHAIRRAELLALGTPTEFVKAIMSTRLATDFRHSAFWRTVWIFLVANAGDVDPMEISPMIDYIQAIRHDRMRDGMIEFGPPQPAFSVKGRTVQSMLRMMREWHRSLGAGSASLSWKRSSFEPLLFEEPGRTILRSLGASNT